MTATVNPTVPSTISAERSAPNPRVWRAGLAAGAGAAVATMAVAAVAAVAQSLDVTSLETAPGEAIPVMGFGQLTLFFTVVGILIARTIGRRARQPRATFVTTTVVLTAISLVPDVLLSTDAATKLTLMTTHLVAAAIVIPVLASRLAAQR
jgi:hypothetical protein